VPVEENGDNLPPLLLVKSDGAYLYGTTDLSTINERVQKLRAEDIIYVVDKRQALHFTQVFRGAKKTGIAPDTKLEHIAFGTVNGPDGKPFKTRAGGVMKLQDLIALAINEAAKKMAEANIAQELDEAAREETARMVGIAALKFADLSHYRLSDYSFDVDKFTTFEGHTGPYLLYNAVRIKSILRRSPRPAAVEKLLPPQTEAERSLLLTAPPAGKGARGLRGPRAAYSLRPGL
jgi:arginyl-tRNA synthetase